MVLSEILFTAVVYLSNNNLLNRLAAIRDAGYLPVPNAHVFPMLKSIKTAFCGGIFFTLTTGTGFCILAFFWAWIVCRTGLKRRTAAVLSLMPLGMILAAINANGMNVFASIAAILIPLPVFLSASSRFRYKRSGLDPARTGAHIAVILILGVAWFARADRNMFVNIRDYVLFSNPAGKAVNAFYYRYTLFPAEVFKTYDQKLLKTCRLKPDPGMDTKKITAALIKNDYLPTKKKPVDLELSGGKKDLVFFHNGKKVLTARARKFIAYPGPVLSSFSNKCDNNLFFRKFTFFSLICTLPLFFYILVHFIFQLLLVWIRNPRFRDIWAAIACLGLGLAFILPLYFLPAGHVPEKALNVKIASPAWTDQRAALKTMAESGIDPLIYTGVEALVKSPHVPVRYWLANALSNSKGPGAEKILRKMIRDPQPNVVCMACFALGRRHIIAARPLFLNLLKTSAHPYVQWYAYKALRKTGWTQSDLS